MRDQQTTRFHGMKTQHLTAALLLAIFAAGDADLSSLRRAIIEGEEPGPAQFAALVSTIHNV